MASFQKRGKKWQYTISHKSGPIRKGGFLTKREAQAAAAVIEAEMQKGIVPQLRKTPFAEYYFNWVKLYKKEIADITLKRYFDTHRAILKYFGDRSIQDIKRPDYQAFLNEYGSKLSKESTRKVHVHCRQCVLDAVDEGFALSDFTRKAVIAGHTNVKRPEDKHLDYQESQMLMAELQVRMKKSKSLVYHFLMLALVTGMRYSELAALKRSKFNFKNDIVRINESWDSNKGKAKPVKTKRSNRLVKVDRPTMNDFETLFEETPPHISGLVFYSPHGKNQVLTNEAVNKTLKKLLKELGLKEITLHGLRHTHCSVLLYQRATPLYVSERMGHASVDTTMRFYSHVIEELREEDTQIAVDTFGNMRAV